MIDKRKFFKVGDLVKIVYNRCSEFGKIGIVVKVDPFIISVKIGDAILNWEKVSSLEKVFWSVS